MFLHTIWQFCIFLVILTEFIQINAENAAKINNQNQVTQSWEIILQEKSLRFKRLVKNSYNDGRIFRFHHYNDRNRILDGENTFVPDLSINKIFVENSTESTTENTMFSSRSTNFVSTENSEELKEFTTVQIVDDYNTTNEFTINTYQTSGTVSPDTKKPDKIMKSTTTAGLDTSVITTEYLKDASQSEGFSSSENLVKFTTESTNNSFEVRKFKTNPALRQHLKEPSKTTSSNASPILDVTTSTTALTSATINDMKTNSKMQSNAAIGTGIALVVIVPTLVGAVGVASAGILAPVATIGTGTGGIASVATLGAVVASVSKIGHSKTDSKHDRFDNAPQSHISSNDVLPHSENLKRSRQPEREVVHHRNPPEKLEKDKPKKKDNTGSHAPNVGSSTERRSHNGIWNSIKLATKKLWEGFRALAGWIQSLIGAALSALFTALLRCCCSCCRNCMKKNTKKQNGYSNNKLAQCELQISDPSVKPNGQQIVFCRIESSDSFLEATKNGEEVAIQVI